METTSILEHLAVIEFATEERLPTNEIVVGSGVLRLSTVSA
jgi:hypothetical protein